MNEATTQPRFCTVLGALALLALGSVPACDFSDGSPILTSEDDGGGDATCDPAECAATCVAAGYASGSCRADACFCESPPPVDADADADAEAEVEAEADAETEAEALDEGGTDEGASPCVPARSEPRVFVDEAADADERPVAIRSGAGFAVFARAPAPITGDGLRFQRFHRDGTEVSVSMWTLSSIEMGPVHPLLELPGGSFVTAFEVPAGEGAGLWVKTFPSSGMGGEVPRQVPGTDERDASPSLAYDGAQVVVVWTKTAPGAGTVEIRIQGADPTTGMALGTATILRTAPPGSGEPRIAWGDRRLALAYFDAGDGALHVLSVDGTFAVTREDDLPPPAGEAIVGYPALAWNGTEFGLAWETRGTAGARLHLATFPPDGGPVGHDVLSDVSLPEAEEGQVALAWGDRTGEWGLAWRRTQASRTTIALARIDGLDFHTIEDPVDLHPETTTAAHPALAYNDGVYLVSWTEPQGTSRPVVYTATYGCAP